MQLTITTGKCFVELYQSHWTSLKREKSDWFSCFIHYQNCCPVHSSAWPITVIRVETHSFSVNFCFIKTARYIVLSVKFSLSEQRHPCRQTDKVRCCPQGWGCCCLQTQLQICPTLCFFFFILIYTEELPKMHDMTNFWHPQKFTKMWNNFLAKRPTREAKSF